MVPNNSAQKAVRKSHTEAIEFTIRISIVTKIVLHVAALICIALGIATYLTVLSESRLLTETLVKMTNEKATQIALATKSAFHSLNWIFVEKLLQQVKEDNPGEVVFVKIVKPNGEVYLANDGESHTETLPPDLLSKKSTIIDYSFFSEKQGKGKLIIQPVNIGDEIWHVVLGLSLQSVHEAIGSLIQRNSTWGGIILFVAMGLSILQSRAISKPLKDLSKSALEAAKGNLANTVPVNSNDEIGLLSFAYNRMLKDLENASNELVSSEKRYKAMVDAASKAEVGILVLQNDREQKGIIKYVNHYVSDLSGYSIDELNSMTYMDLVHPESVDSVAHWYNISSLESEEHQAYRFSGITKKGVKIQIEMGAGTSDFEGRRAVICYIKDVTQKLEAEAQLKLYSENLEKMVEQRTAELEDMVLHLKTAQSQLIQSEKMASVGQLAAGVAHEINNPTGFVNSNLKTLSGYQDDLWRLIEKYRDTLSPGKSEGSSELREGEWQARLEEIEALESQIDIDYILTDTPDLLRESMEGMERIKKIVIDLKDFAHPGADRIQTADINQCLDSTLNVVRNELKYKTTVSKEYGDLPPVSCYPQQLNQVFMNLLVNAAQAIEQQGQIRIATRAEDGRVIVTISDTGAGIPEENLARIFEPFFTTKAVGKGTGLGLHVAYKIVKKHKGSIHVESTPGKGTAFTIEIPVNAN